ncbi:MAG: twin-arginine translocase subunit TatC [Verrucomicrobiales bacterium]
MIFLKKLLSLGGNAAAKKFQDQEKPFLDHLEDLRGTMVKVFGTLIACTIIAFFFYEDLIKDLDASYRPEANERMDANLDTDKLSVFTPVEGFMSVIKICLYAALIGSFPILLYFIGEFIIPGLNKKEKKLILPVVFASFILFSIGVLFAYYVVIPRALEFFDSFQYRCRRRNGPAVQIYGLFHNNAMPCIWSFASNCRSLF